MLLKEIVKLPPREFTRKTVHFLHRSALDAFYRIFYPKFYKIKKECNGLCLVSVYKEIYERSLILPDYDIVEIGGAAGASSVAFALGLKDSQKQGGVIVVEKCYGGSRERYGGFDENYRIITNNFEKFGVRDFTILYPHAISIESASDVLSLIRTKSIAAFASDADGRIDRDFFLFWPKLIPGGLIVIDDYPKHLSSEKEKRIEYYQTGRVKQVLTYELLNLFIDWGLFKPVKRVSETIFGYKPEDADFEKFDLQMCQDIVKDIEGMYIKYKK